MPISWLSWKKSLACKSEPGEVHDPQRTGDFNAFTIFDPIKASGCSRSLTNLKDVIHSSRRVVEHHSTGSPLSVQSCDISSSINHESILRNRDLNRESEICGSISKPRSNLGIGASAHHTPQKEAPFKRLGSCYDCKCAQSPAICSSVYKHTGSQNISPRAAAAVPLSLELVCQRCGQMFIKYEALESHHLVKHVVTQLRDGDSSRNVIEIIFRTGWFKSGISEVTIERILKVNNMQKTIARFEDYRDLVKTKASKLPKKHPRCLADGNELLRFYGTTVACPLGMNGSSSLCGMLNCNVCKIIRVGFLETKNKEWGAKGVITTTGTSGKADEWISVMGEEEEEEESGSKKRAMLVCRVIAGRIRKCCGGGSITRSYESRSSSSSMETVSLPGGFDSMAGEAAAAAVQGTTTTASHSSSNVEELHVFNANAILPCFVVIYNY